MHEQIVQRTCLKQSREHTGRPGRDELLQTNFCVNGIAMVSLLCILNQTRNANVDEKQHARTNCARDLLKQTKNKKGHELTGRPGRDELLQINYCVILITTVSELCMFEEERNKFVDE